ncbi:hypothetical protein JOM56_013051 [Amanita muscaria]
MDGYQERHGVHGGSFVLAIMDQYWKPDTQYNHGNVVEYNGIKYKALQTHHSQSSWAPNLRPTLWARHEDTPHKRRLPCAGLASYTIGGVAAYKSSKQDHR